MEISEVDEESKDSLQCSEHQNFPYILREYFQVISKIVDGKGSAKCFLCPKSKTFTFDLKVTTNLLKHLKRIHPGACDRYKQEVKQNSRQKLKRIKSKNRAPEIAESSFCRKKKRILYTRAGIHSHLKVFHDTISESKKNLIPTSRAMETAEGNEDSDLNEKEEEYARFSDASEEIEKVFIQSKIKIEKEFMDETTNNEDKFINAVYPGYEFKTRRQLVEEIFSLKRQIETYESTIDRLIK